MPNAIALLALVSWPIASALLFRALPMGRALIASLIVGYLFLPPPPAGFDFPLMPPLTKETIPSLVALFACLILTKGALPLWPERRLTQVLLVLFVVSPAATVLTNMEPVFWGGFGLPGLQPREGIALMINQVLLIIPFLLARAILIHQSDQRDLLWALVIGGLVYSLPMLVEVRVAPMLNIWIYGYFQHSFDQMMRFGGFRPIVFLYHGLWVAFFALTSLLAALSLVRSARPRTALRLLAIGLYLLVVLVLCKSVASLIYALVMLPIVLLLGLKMQLRVAFLMALLATSYPLMKGLSVVPEAEMITAAERIDPDRAASIIYRFNNENVLLDRASQKPLFGWGSWGRNHEYDSEDGTPLTVADGRWIITIGKFGWVGFIAEMGLLASPIFFLLWAVRGVGSSAAVRDTIGPYAVPIVLILGVNLIDLLPNATITPLTWLFAGAVLGFAERLQVVRAAGPEPIRTIL